MANPQDDLTHDGLSKEFYRLWGDWVKRNNLFLRPDTAADAYKAFTFKPSSGLMSLWNPTTSMSLAGTTISAGAITKGAVSTALDWAWDEVKQAELPVEKEVGAIKAYRVWEWGWDDDNRPTLKAVVWRTRWTGPVMVADCVPENGTADGAVMKHHGLYAAKDLRTVLLESGYDADVVGEVALFGRVVEHEHGFRAEKAMIRRLVLLDGMDLLEHPTLDRDLAERYGCEVSTDIRTLMGDES